MPVVATGVWGAVSRGWEAFNTAVEHLVSRLIAGLARHHGQYGVLATTWPTGSMVLWAVVLLGACLIFYYL